ncbi:MAG: phosphatase PAP2 family protein [Bacteroidetes bacterium]|nr:phosphatase PAP2 family protein [Bacteroidota bacterium]
MKLSAYFFRILILLSVIVLFTNSSYAQNWDINLLQNINPQNPNSNTFKTISNTAEPLCVAVPISMYALSLINNNQHLKINAYQLVASLAVNAVATEGFKIIVNRDRPFVTYPSTVFPISTDEKNKSMPSGHTSFSFTTATSVYLMYPKWYVALPAFAWATSVGYSRMYLGLHYPSDVLMGAVVGSSSAIITNWARKNLINRKKKNLAKTP